LCSVLFGLAGGFRSLRCGGPGAGAGSRLFIHCVLIFDELLRGALGHRVSVEIADLVRLSAVQHGPGPFDQLPSDRDACLGVRVSTVDHEPVVELG
jgi:hypothetical protein